MTRLCNHRHLQAHGPCGGGALALRTQVPEAFAATGFDDGEWIAAGEVTEEDFDREIGRCSVIGVGVHFRVE